MKIPTVNCVILLFYFVLSLLPSPTQSAKFGCVKRRMPLKSFYPDTTIKRFEFPIPLASWKSNLTGYAPPSYSAPCPNVSKCDLTLAGLKFNRRDGRIQRRSILGKYSVNRSNIPLNPLGRTGIVGRGSLPRYGPNHLVVLMMKRIISSCEQYAITKRGSHYDLDMFPSDFVDDPYEEVVPSRLMSIMTDGLRDFPKKSIPGIISEAIKKRRLLYWGATADNRNTDNAWVEKIIYELSDKSLNLLGLMDLSEEDEFNIRWTCMSKRVARQKVEITQSRNYPTTADNMHRCLMRFRNSFRSKAKRSSSSRAAINGSGSPY